MTSSSVSYSLASTKSRACTMRPFLEGSREATLRQPSRGCPSATRCTGGDVAEAHLVPDGHGPEACASPCPCRGVERLGHHQSWTPRGEIVGRLRHIGSAVTGPCADQAYPACKVRMHSERPQQ